MNKKQAINLILKTCLKYKEKEIGVNELRYIISECLELLEKDLPCGVSAWRDIGKKFGYWDYFKQEHKDYCDELVKYNKKCKCGNTDERVAVVYCEHCRRKILEKCEICGKELILADKENKYIYKYPCSCFDKNLRISVG